MMITQKHRSNHEILFSFNMLLRIYIHSMAFRIRGHVYDAASHEQLIDASIPIQCQSISTLTSLDGGFQLNNLPPGSYHLHCSYLGYTSADTTVQVEARGSELWLDIFLHSASSSLLGITVTGANAGTDQYARHAEQMSTNISNIISAKAIQISPDITIANVLQRVSGVSLEPNSSGEGDFAIIRGMDCQRRLYYEREPSITTYPDQ